jgi:hypothetical protein
MRSTSFRTTIFAFGLRSFFRRGAGGYQGKMLLYFGGQRFYVSPALKPFHPGVDELYGMLFSGPEL